MPHARPHFGQGVIPTLPYFSWKVQMKGEHELQYVLGYTPQIQLGSRDATWRLRMEDKIGSVEVGKYAELAGTLDVRDVEVPSDHVAEQRQAGEVREDGVRARRNHDGSDG